MNEVKYNIKIFILFVIIFEIKYILYYGIDYFIIFDEERNFLFDFYILIFVFIMI